MQAVGLPTLSYVADTALERDDRSSDEELDDDEPDNPITIVNHATGPTVENGKPLLFIYDCETTGGSHLRDHVMEVGSVVYQFLMGYLSVMLSSPVCVILLYT